MPDLLDALLHAPANPLAPPPSAEDVRDYMVEQAVAVVNADPELITVAQRTDYVETCADVLAYRDKLSDEERHDFEGRIVMRAGARAVNEFFGYHKRISAMQRELIRKRSVQEAEAQFRQVTSGAYTQLRQNARETEKKRRHRPVVGDWLEATRAAVGAKA